MKIKIRLFATLADAAGSRELELEAGMNCTLQQVWDQLAARYPKLAPHGKTVLRAVNEEFGRPDTVIQSGDEVAFFPPVSGG